MLIPGSEREPGRLREVSHLLRFPCAVGERDGHTCSLVRSFVGDDGRATPGASNID